MCDCYGEPCKICGTMIPMHLGGFDTDHLEISVLCGECIEERLFFKEFERYPHVNWSNTELADFEKKYKAKPLIKVRVFALTKNAIKNCGYNHPNMAHTEIESSNKIPKKYLEYWK